MYDDFIKIPRFAAPFTDEQYKEYCRLSITFNTWLDHTLKTMEKITRNSGTIAYAVKVSYTKAYDYFIRNNGQSIFVLADIDFLEILDNGNLIFPKSENNS